MGSDCLDTTNTKIVSSFNPRSRMGSDILTHVSRDIQQKFQSTLPHGERRGIVLLINASCLFQSTLPHGERLDELKAMFGMEEFQSTLPHGERPAICVLSKHHILFQSTLPHGERLAQLPQEVHPYTCFNPRSRMGSDPRFALTLQPVFCFNPRSRMGSDVVDDTLVFYFRVSIHAPAWGAT